MTDESMLTRQAFPIVILGIPCVPDVYAQSHGLAGIAHVAFRVNELQKSREFYRPMGFEQVEFTRGSLAGNP